jgi:hypothetical protein
MGSQPFSSCVLAERQLELTGELLRQSEWPDVDSCEELPPDLARFRPRVP